MTPELQTRVLNRLNATGVADKSWALVIVAALDGGGELDAFLDGTSKRQMPPPSNQSGDAARPEPPGVYVSSLTVEGFRGIGAPATLKFPPGPGLVLVVGRNGSGKSSFAEGLEVLLTDQNYRWEDRPKVWQEGWHNLHHQNLVSLKADLLVEGQGALTASRQWTTGKLDVSESTVIRGGKRVEGLDSDSWKIPLKTFRPFLSYNELGSLLEEGPSHLYDALSGVLGLEELVMVQTMLAEARKSRQALVDSAKKRAAELIARISALEVAAGDARLETAKEALRWPNVDLLKLEQLVTGGATEDSMLLDHLQGLSFGLNVEEIHNAAHALEQAERACAAFAGTSVERSRERADLLEGALRFHDKHQDATCPVCSSVNVLSPSWHARTAEEIAALREEARASVAAEANRKDRFRAAQRFLEPPPPVLSQAVNLGLPSLAEARRQWMTWSEGREITTATALVAHLLEHGPTLVAAVADLVEDAAIEAKRREDVWQPIAVAIAEWLPRARRALRAIPRIAELKAAEEWWKGASAEIRDERFAPVADRAMAIWKQLRLQSNVDLGRVELEGTATSRKVKLCVTVDGKPAEALGVMSQGELHALALSLFLPRATLKESPFRFVWIDDPVQSMDPSRVEGLARVLDDTAKTRQVVVFTHDDRLPEAVRRLGIKATVLAVTRRANSVVEVRPALNPVDSNLDDARALALTNELPSGVASRVVPGFCRTAIEAACMEVVRRCRLGRGQLHQEVEDLLKANSKPHPLMALALFGDAERTNDVMPRLSKANRDWAAAFQACKAGSHTGYDGDLGDSIAHTERLARFVQEECR